MSLSMLMVLTSILIMLGGILLVAGVLCAYFAEEKTHRNWGVGFIIAGIMLCLAGIIWYNFSAPFAFGYAILDML